MLQFDNQTPFSCEGVIGMDAGGRDALILVVKGTFQILPKVTVAKEQVPVTLVDEYVGEPGFSSILTPSDVLLPKPGFDVVFKGHAHAPGGRPVPALMAAMAFGGGQKAFRVTGDRFWTRGRMSSPEPFVELPLIYENTFGGVHHFKPDLPLGPESCVAVAGNPVGTGFAGKRKSEELEGMRMPNIERPDRLISAPSDQGVSVGLGAIAPMWVPRRSYAGTYDQHWIDAVAPALPADFDSRFFQVGAEGLRFEAGSLNGGEPIRLVNLSPEPDIRFEVPLCPLQAKVVMSSKPQDLPLKIETLVIEPDENRFSLVWKGLFSCERKATLIESVSVCFAKLGN